MRQLVLTAVVVLGWASPGLAQNFQPSASPSDRPVLESPVHNYETYRTETPQDSVRQAAQFKAQQRRLRMESARWYGVSTARPMANATNYTRAGTYSGAAQWSGYSTVPFFFLGTPHQSMYIQLP